MDRCVHDILPSGLKHFRYTGEGVKLYSFEQLPVEIECLCTSVTTNRSFFLEHLPHLKKLRLIKSTCAVDPASMQSYLIQNLGLTELDVSYTFMSGACLTRVMNAGGLCNLTVLGVGALLGIDDAFLTLVGNSLPYLSQLNVSDNKIEMDVGLRSICAQGRLTHLNVALARLSAAAIREIAMCRDMENLSLHKCRISGAAEAALCALGKCKNILVLNADSCTGVTDKVVSVWLKNLRKLKVLLCSSLELSDDIFAWGKGGGMETSEICDRITSDTTDKKMRNEKGDVARHADGVRNERIVKRVKHGEEARICEMDGGEQKGDKEAEEATANAPKGRHRRSEALDKEDNTEAVCRQYTSPQMPSMFTSTCFSCVSASTSSISTTLGAPTSSTTATAAASFSANALPSANEARPKLRVLSLAHSNITDTGLRIISERFPHLVCLSLVGVKRVRSFGVNHLQKLQCLRKLIVISCPEVGKVNLPAHVDVIRR